MVQVTRLNNQKFTINALLIERLESTPDTMIILSNGKKYLVLESEEEVREMVLQFYQKLHFFQKMNDVSNHVSNQE